MSQQTDELLLQPYTDEGEMQEPLKAQQEKRLRKEEQKQHLRLLQDLQNTPGYKLFHAQLCGELEGALSAMERADNTMVQSRACGTYCALLRTSRLVEEQIKELIQTLNAPEE